MANTRKNAPAAVTTAPPIDFASLAANVTTATITTGGGRFANNPFVPLLRASYDADQAGDNGWRQNVVPGYHVRELVAALRNAQMQLAGDEIGLRLRYAYTVERDGADVAVENGRLDDVPEDDRSVNVMFLGRPRKVYGAKDEENGNGSDVDSGDDNDQDPGF